MKEDRLSVHLAVWLVAALAGFLVIVGLPTSASAADHDPAFDQFPITYTFTASTTPATYSDGKMTIGVPGWDGRLRPKTDGTASIYSYGYVYPITVQYTRETASGTIPNFTSKVWAPDGRGLQSGGTPAFNKTNMAKFNVPEPWPAVCTGATYCMASNLEWSVDSFDSPYFGPGGMVQFQKLAGTSTFTITPAPVDWTPLPKGGSTVSPPTGLPTAPVEPEPEPEPPTTDECFPEGWTWDVGAMLGEAVECLFVPKSTFMADLTQGLDEIGPSKFPVVMNKVVNDWEFVSTHGCTGITLDLSGIVPDAPPTQLLNACGSYEAGGPGCGQIDSPLDGQTDCRRTAYAMRDFARVSNIVIGLGAVVVTFLSVKRSIGATVQYNTGGE